MKLLLGIVLAPFAAAAGLLVFGLVAALMASPFLAVALAAAGSWGWAFMCAAFAVVGYLVWDVLQDPAHKAAWDRPADSGVYLGGGY